MTDFVFALLRCIDVISQTTAGAPFFEPNSTVSLILLIMMVMIDDHQPLFGPLTSNVDSRTILVSRVLIRNEGTS